MDGGDSVYRRAKVKLFNLKFLILCCVVSTGCSRIPQSELIGRWRADYENGFQILTLNGNGSFRQEVTLREERGATRVLTNEGTWKYPTDDNSSHVILANCMVPFEQDGTIKSRIEGPYGLCSWVVEREWLVSSKLRIGSIEGSPFRKLKEQ